MSESGRGSAHGKAILIGEHAVVHGTSAIAIPVSLEVEVELGDVPATGLPDSFVDWFRSLAAERTGRALVPATISGDLPVGAGLGSSAALGAACLRALQSTGGIRPEELQDLCDTSEALFHGNPSGVDVRTVLADSPIGFRRNDGHLEFWPVSVSGCWFFDLWVTPTGPSTAEMVARVTRNLDQSGHRSERLEYADTLVSAAGQALAAGDAPAVGQHMSKFHDWLHTMGASTDLLDQLVDYALAAGALGAKLTGGGGGGAMIVLWPDEQRPDLNLPTSVRTWAIRVAGSPDS